MPARTNDRSGSSRFRRHRGVWITLLVVVGLVLAVRFGLSPLATMVANRKLAAMDGFTGRVESVEIPLWSGSIVVHDLVLRDENHPDAPPVLRVPKATFTGALGPLLRGKLGGEAVIERPESHLIKRRQFDGMGEALQEAEDEMKERQREAKRWQEALRQAIPMEMTRVEVTEGVLRFIDEAHEPQVDVRVQDLHMIATDIRNRPDPSGRPMNVEIKGTTTGNGRLRITLEADPMAEPFEFASSFELKDLHLPKFNDFLRAYTDTDVSRGTFDIYMEMTAEAGRYQGYVRPFFSNLDFENVDDDEKPFWSQVKDEAAGVVSSILKNDDTDKVATETPFSGTYGENDVGLWETVENLWANAFVRALREGLRGGSAAE